MPFKSLFVGVGRHKSASVRDLPGPPRDALAMKSLFQDSLTDGEFSLLIDSDATTQAISDSLASLFLNASSDDTVLFHFSGHGSENHELIPYDVEISRIEETTVPMGRIIEFMQSSKAKNIICFLDCCFSGGVGAKVLTGLPRTRGGSFSFDFLAGEGRLIVAASEPDSEALECPARNFGLLTIAIMETLRESSVPLPVGLFCDELQRRVRAEAGKYGFKQEALVLNQIAGGLLIPNLTAGSSYTQHFPNASSIHFSADYSGMRDAGISDEIIDLWRRDIVELNELQLQSLNEQRLFEVNSLVVQAPTSSGKTFIGEMASVYQACRGRRSLFLFPYKALASEKTDRFQQIYKNAGFRIIKCTGDSRDQVPAFLMGKYDIALMTYEMALSLLSSNPNTLRTLGCVVIDEAHFVSDENRGITVELLMTLIRRSQRSLASPQLICLSAVSGQESKLHNWLGASLQKSTKRPVDLIEGVLSRDGSCLQLMPDGTVLKEQLIRPAEIRVLGRQPGARDVLIPLIRRHIETGQSVLVFRSTRSASKHTALYLAEAFDIADCSSILTGLNQGDPSSDTNDLVTCLKKGTAFHNSNLSASERLAVERAFRDSANPLKILVATSTLAAGINTPADTVFIVEHMLAGPEKKFFPVTDYKNMSGRAGRLGFSSAGRSLMIANHSIEQRSLFDRYIKASLPALTSTLSNAETETWVLRLLLQVGAVEQDEVADILSDTFGGYLKNLVAVGALDGMRDGVAEAIVELLDNGMLEKERRKVFLTPLGRVCARSLLSYTSSHRIVKSLRKIGRKCSVDEIMAIVQCTEMCDSVYTPYQKNSQKESRWIANARSFLALEIIESLSTGAVEINAFQKRCKRTCILADWIEGVKTQELESKYSTTNFAAVAAGDIRKIVEATRLVFQPVVEIAQLLLAQDFDSKEVDDFLRRLEFGVPQKGVELTKLPDAFDRGDLLSFIFDGVHTLPDLIAGTFRRMVKFKNEAKRTAFEEIKEGPIE